MTFLDRVKSIKFDALRAHPAFPWVIIGWLVLLFGLAAFALRDGLLPALGGAIAGGLLGRYLVTRFGETVGNVSTDDLAADEVVSERSRTIGVSSSPEVDSFQELDDDLARFAEDKRPQFLSVDELRFEENAEGDLDWDAQENPAEVPGEDQASDEDGSDDDWPAEPPEWVDPSEALEDAKRTHALSHSEDEQFVPNEPDAISSASPAPPPAACEGATNEAPIASEPPAKLEVAAEPGEHAAAKLRSQDLSEMSLVQMIERLAFALDDCRASPEEAAAQNGPDQAPDRAIAEALRALPALTQAANVYATDGNAALALSTREQAEATEMALRDALEKLQKLSGG